MNCPSCGAPQLMTPGEPIERCRFCHAAFVPERAAIAEIVAEADRALIAAEIAEQRSLRRGMLTLSRSSAANIIPYIVLGSFLPMTSIGAIGITVSWLFEDAHAPKLGGVFLMWAMALANAGMLGLVYFYRRFRRERWEELIAALMRELGGVPLASFDDVNRWLDRHWAGPIPMSEMFPGSCLVAFATTLDGYPLQIVANPVGASEHYPGYLVARLSAWFPRPDQARSTEAFRAARQSLESRDFEIDTARTGLVARANPRACRRFKRSGDVRSFLEGLRWLARTAREAGAAPVDVA